MKYVVFLVFVLLAVGCSQKSVREEPAFMSEGKDRKDLFANQIQESAPIDELKNAYFDYDEAVLRPDARAAIRKNAEWLKNHPDAHVQIEGHCDERGTPDYNYKLGEGRAEAAKKYLVQLGIPANRIKTVSYGAIDGQSEKTWALHRKAAFMILYAR